MAESGSVGAAVGSALAWGGGDFLGGLASRRGHVLRVVAATQVLGVLLLAAGAIVAGERAIPLADVAWGAAAGLAGVVGIASLYAALASGRMGYAAPISGVLSAMAPVLIGAALEGSPGPLAYGGMLLALAGITLATIGKAERPPRRTFALALLSGVAFGAFLVLIGQTTGPAFFLPLLAARITSSALLCAALLWRRPGGETPWLAIVGAGVLDTAGNALFFLAVRLGRLDVAGVLSSMYPLGTLLLARLVLGERLTRAQWTGAAVMLVAILLLRA